MERTERRTYEAPELTDFGPIGKVTQGPVGELVETAHSSVIDPVLEELEGLD